MIQNIKLLKEDYPSHFNFVEFHKLNSFSKRKKYCDYHLDFIAGGSARRVYAIDDTKVLKLAVNEKGIAQNEVEIGFKREKLSCLAEVYHCDDDRYTYLEMERAKKFSVSDFKRITGISFDIFSDYVKTQEYQEKGFNYFKIKYPEMQYELDNNEFIVDIMDLVTNYDISIEDLAKKSTFGMVKRGGRDEIIIIDFGLNSQVYNNFYQRV